MEKDNLRGPETIFYLPDPEDNSLVQKEIVRKELNVGDALHIHDNRCYHTVGPCKLLNRNQSGFRTLLVILSPADYMWTGEPNSRNNLSNNPQFKVEKNNSSADEVDAEPI